MPTDLSATLAEIKTLSVDDRIRLVEAIWQDIEGERQEVRLSEAQLRHLDRRIAAYEASPDDVLPWDEVRDSLAIDP